MLNFSKFIIIQNIGSDILDIQVFIQASEILFDAAKNFKNLEFIDFGSGFKVPYKEGDIETDIEELGTKLSEKFNRSCVTRNIGSYFNFI